ncbi:MAG: hypothetical protein HYY98_05225 [Burkholderiales bacterium]|nr:hypothetical protein [Burkholderiales bacterium]
MKEEPLGMIIGTITACKPVAGTKHLHHLIIDVGTGHIEIASSLPHYYEPGTLLGCQVPIKTDVEPITIHGIRSTARLIAIRNQQGMPVLLQPQTPVANGDEVI